MPYSRTHVLPHRFTEEKNLVIFHRISDISCLKCAWLTLLRGLQCAPDPQLLAAPLGSPRCGVYSAPPTHICLLHRLAHPPAGFTVRPRPTSACCTAWLTPLQGLQCAPDPQLLAAPLGSPRCGVYSAPPTHSCLLHRLAHPPAGFTVRPRPTSACCTAWLTPLRGLQCAPDPQLLAAPLGSPRCGVYSAPPTHSCLLHRLAHPAAGFTVRPRPTSACCTAWLTPLRGLQCAPDPHLLAAPLGSPRCRVYSAPPTHSCLLHRLAHPAAGFTVRPRPTSARCTAWLTPLRGLQCAPGPHLLAAPLGSPRCGVYSAPPTHSCLLHRLAHPAAGFTVRPRPTSACCTAWLTPLRGLQCAPGPHLLAAPLGSPRCGVYSAPPTHICSLHRLAHPAAGFTVRPRPTSACCTAWLTPLRGLQCAPDPQLLAAPLGSPRCGVYSAPPAHICSLHRLAHPAAGFTVRPRPTAACCTAWLTPLRGLQCAPGPHLLAAPAWLTPLQGLQCAPDPHLLAAPLGSPRCGVYSAPPTHSCLLHRLAHRLAHPLRGLQCAPDPHLLAAPLGSPRCGVYSAPPAHICSLHRLAHPAAGFTVRPRPTSACCTAWLTPLRGLQCAPGPHLLAAPLGSPRCGVYSAPPTHICLLHRLAHPAAGFTVRPRPTSACCTAWLTPLRGLQCAPGPHLLAALLAAAS